jgi:uncharacterized protein YeaO (DUF488 family)
MAKLGTFRIHTPRERGEGLRIGTVRYLPRGVRKEDYARQDYFDVWLPLLAPSRELVQWYFAADWTEKHRDQFFRRYQREMLGNPDSRQVIQTLAALSKHTPISIGCYCEDESRCHRAALIKLLEDAAR